MNPIIFALPALLLLPKKSNGPKERREKANAALKEFEKNQKKKEEINKATTEASLAFEDIIKTGTGKSVVLVSDAEYRTYLKSMGVAPNTIEVFVKDLHRVRAIAPTVEKESWWPAWLTTVATVAGIALLVGPAVLGYYGMMSAEAFAAVEIGTVVLSIGSAIEAASRGVGAFVAELSAQAYGKINPLAGSDKFLSKLAQDLAKRGLKFVLNGEPIF